MLHKKIQSDLAHGNSRLLAQSGAQHLQIFRQRIVHIHRVNAVGRGAVGMLSAQTAHHIKVGAGNGRHDDAADSGSLRVTHNIGL